MKKSVDIIGLPVVDISEGVEIGTVKKLLINATEGSVDALVIDDGKWYLSAKLLPFSAIAGLGESALTIISDSALVSVENAPDFEQLLCQDVAVIGTKVLTKAGFIQGTVTEIVVDATGKISICEIEGLSGEYSEIPVDRVLTFGKKVLIVADLDGTSEETVPTIESVPLKKTISPVVEEVIPDVAPVIAAVVNEEAKETTTDDSAKKFDEKQRKYLLGKQASRRIETDNGVVIVEQGGEINEEVLQKAKLAGKFVELSMNIQ